MLPNIAIAEKLPYARAEHVSSKVRSSFIFALIIFLIFLVITLSIPPRSGRLGYFAALKDKHHHLETLKSPKIVFIGGSNLAFGLDSTFIENKFHIPVANMGICAPLGLRYILEEVKDNIKAGDVVVLVPEYGILQNTIDGTPDLIHAVEVYPRSALFLIRAYTQSPQAFFNFLAIIREIPTAKWSAFYTILTNMWQKGHYDPDLIENWEIKNQLGKNTRFYFDKHGDYFGHFAKPNMSFEPAWGLIKDMGKEAANLINDFDQFARKRNVQVIIIPPPIPREDISPSHCSTISVASWPDQKLTVPILGSPQRYAFDANLFYQPPYHLNASGRSIRTKLLSEDLDRYFRKTHK